MNDAAIKSFSLIVSLMLTFYTYNPFHCAYIRFSYASISANLEQRAQLKYFIWLGYNNCSCLFVCLVGWFRSLLLVIYEYNSEAIIFDWFGPKTSTVILSFIHTAVCLSRSFFRHSFDNVVSGLWPNQWLVRLPRISSMAEMQNRRRHTICGSPNVD